MECFNNAATGDRQTYNALRKPPGKPLVFVQQKDGQVTADPEVVDEKARDAWSRIYKGKGGPELILVHKFFELYAEDLPEKREPAEVEDIAQEDAQYATH